MTDDGVIKTAGLVTTLVGIFTVVITWLRQHTSKDGMPHVPPPIDVLSAINRLSESQERTLIKIAEMAKDVEHVQEKMTDLEKRCEHDHRMVKLLRETLISWGKLDAERERQSRQAGTETGDLPIPGNLSPNS